MRARSLWRHSGVLESVTPVFAIQEERGRFTVWAATGVNFFVLAFPRHCMWCWPPGFSSYFASFNCAAAHSLRPPLKISGQGPAIFSVTAFWSRSARSEHRSASSENGRASWSTDSLLS